MARTFRSLIASLLLVVTVFATGTNVAYAANVKVTAAAAGSDPIKAATVNIYCRLEAGRKTYSSTGSGVIVSDRGIILTNAHVAQYLLLPQKKGRIESSCTVRMGSPAKEKYTASLLYIPGPWLSANDTLLGDKQPKGTGENDFALLYITGAKKGALPTTFPTLPIDTLKTLTEGTDISIAGYPAGELDFKQVRSKLKLVIAPSSVTGVRGFTGGAVADVLTLAPSEAGQGGVSGGPVVTAAGVVSGIVTSKSTAEDDTRLRAISLPYINRMLMLQTGLPLQSLLAGDLTARATVTRASVPQSVIDAIGKTFYQSRK